MRTVVGKEEKKTRKSRLVGILRYGTAAERYKEECAQGKLIE